MSSSATAYRGTPTQRQLQEQAIEHTVHPEQADSEAWATRWTCRSNTCNFRGKLYWYDLIAPHKHYPITTQQLSTWKAQLAKDTSGRLSSDTPPETTLAQMKQGLRNVRKNERRAIKKEEQTTNASSILTSDSKEVHVHVHNHTNITEHTSGRKELEDLDTKQYIRELYLRDQQAERSQSSTRTSTTPFPQENLRSSPVDSGMASKIPEYIDWLKNERPAFKQQFDNACNILLDEGFALDNIQQMKLPSQWEGISIRKGIGQQLASNIKR